MSVRPHRRTALRRCAIALAGALCLALGAGQPARAAGSLTIDPVTIQMAPGQMATSLRIINRGNAPTSFQVRAFDWSQSGNGPARLTPTDTLLESPPLGTIAPGATQIVRLALRRPPEGSEASYRILIDQLPPPAAPGVVRIMLRFSIPIFAEPATRVAPLVRWRVEDSAGRGYLVATNAGTSHEVVRDIALSGPDGHVWRVDTNAPPYILAGATRRWHIASPPPAPGTPLRLSANTDTGRISQPVRVVGAP
ncbi:MAG TPA: fimbria/pilus periplasmic chaperone [Acidiphilium sp.]